MHTLRKMFGFSACKPALRVALFVGLGLAAATAVAQPANDNYAAAEEVSGLWVSAAGDNTGATAESGEPSHGGFAPLSSIWYKWTAPSDGEVTVDTYGSQDPDGVNLDTVVAVYAGSTLNGLRQVAANDDLFPFQQTTDISGLTGPADPESLSDFYSFTITQPYTGPSTLRFNAAAGTTYYIAVDSKFGLTGPISLNLAYNSAGVFRFASEDHDMFTGLPLYQCSEAEGSADHETTYWTYYTYHPGGALVTVTRVAGSTGRMLVDYATQDDTAIGGEDYLPVSGTLVFDDFEMSKTIVIRPFWRFSPEPLPSRELLVTLSNPRPDAMEDTVNVSAPRLDTPFATARVRILSLSAPGTDPDQLPEPADNPDDPPTPPSHAVFNFMNAHFRVPEDVNNYWTQVRIDVNRTFDGTDDGDGATIHYRINNFLGSRQDASEEENNISPLQPESDFATCDPPSSAGQRATNADYTLAQGSVTFGAREAWRPIYFTITNDTLTEFNEDFRITLYRERNSGLDLVGQVNEATVTILFDDQDPPAGSVDQMHNPDFGLSMVPPVSTTPENLPHPGTDGVVYSAVVQPDNATVIGGNFLSYNNTPRNCIARMNPDGSLDATFNPGSGANDFISSVALTDGGNMYVAGGFSSFNGITRAKVARLNANGSLDNTFNPGLGADDAIWAALVQEDGKLIVAGEFSSFDGASRARIARLNTDGSLDLSFDPGINGPNGTIWAMALQSNGRIIIGGDFTSIGGLNRSRIARLNADGSLDTSFNPGEGVDGTVFALALRPDGKIWIGGEFSSVNGSLYTRFARLNGNGSVDLTFDPGTGANNTIYSIALHSSGSVYVGGMFTRFNGTHRLGFARLLAEGTVDTTFLDTAYNQFAGLHRARFSDPLGIVFTSAVQPDGNVIIGGAFSQVGGGQANANIRFDPNYPTNQYNAHVWYEPKARNGLRNRSNIARLIGGETPGPGNIGFANDSYSASENQASLSVPLIRDRGTLGYLSANFAVRPGVVQSGSDYVYNGLAPIYLSSWLLPLLGPVADTPASDTRMHSDGIFGGSGVPIDIFGHQWFYYTRANVTLSFPDDKLTQGNRTTTLELANPENADKFFLGAANIPLGGALGNSRVQFTLIDDDHRAGVLSFAAPVFYVNENGTNALITVVRNDGSHGTVTVAYNTSDGTAKAGTDYQNRFGTLSFGNNVRTQTFLVPIINNALVQPTERTFNVRIYNPGGGASIGLSNAVVNVVDDDYLPGYVNFTAATYTTNEGAGAVIIKAARTGGNTGTLTVQCVTTNGSALSGVDYVGTTNLLQWNHGTSGERTIVIPLIDNILVGGDRFFTVRLENAQVNNSSAPTVLAGAVTRTTVNIAEDDFFGSLGFSQTSYYVNENGGYATITVIRTSGTAEAVSVNYHTVDGTAVSTGPVPNFQPRAGTLNFAPGQVAQSFDIPILNDGLFNGSPFRFTVVLDNSTPTDIIAAQNVAVVEIVDVQSYNVPAGSVDTAFDVQPGFNGDIYSVALQADGSIVAAGDFTIVNSVPRNRVARVASNGSLDSSFLFGLTGANEAIRALLVQSDGKILCGGAFTSFNGINRNHIVRLISDGLVDSSFNPGSGADSTIFALAETFIGSGQRFLAGGSFTSFNGQPRSGLVRLMDDGTIDEGFSPTLTINGTVYAIATYPTNTVQGGKILIGGDFTSVNGIGMNRVARLNPDGTLDATFNPGSGAADTVRALAIQLDGRVLVGGAFTNFNGLAFNRIVRLNIDGSLDSSFQIGQGASDTVLDLAIQPDNRILAVGQFLTASGVNRSRITRLLPDGSIDPAINFGYGADSFIASIALQPDGHIVIGGGFNLYDGQPRKRLARVYGGSLAGSGSLEFTAADFKVSESDTNALVTVRRRGGTAGNISIDFATSPGTAIPGVNYSQVNAALAFPIGETFQNVLVPVLDDIDITPDLTINLALSNPSPPATIGNQPVATLTILNTDSTVSFASATYRVFENAANGVANIQLVRQGSARGSATVDFITTTNGTAIPYTNYVPVTNTVVFLEGQSNAIVHLPILRNLAAQGDVTVEMFLTNGFNTVPVAPASALLTILEVDQAPGQFLFSATNYTVLENAGSLPVTIIRTNGRTGVVSVNYTAIPGSAQPGIKYQPAAGILSFDENEISKTFYVDLIDDTIVGGATTFNLELSNPTGGATILQPTNMPVTILDNDLGITFSSAAYVVSETDSAVFLTVFRTNSSVGTTTVNYSTTNITAEAGTNYVPLAGTLTFTNGETIKTFAVEILDDPRVTGNLSFGVALFNPSAPAQLLNPSTTVVNITDSDPGFTFVATNSFVFEDENFNLVTNAAYSAVKSGTNVLITVLRSNANTGIVSVNYSTSNRTALAGVDYTTTSGTLTFSNGVSLQSFTVPIINNRVVQGDRTFDINLFNPSAGAQLVPPSTATVVITDDISGLNFSAPSYSIAENGVAATITVLRTTYTNSTVSVSYSTTNGTGRAGIHYVSVNGTLTFTNGETVKTFTVPVIDNTVVDGDHTALLTLSGPVGNALLVEPSAATLNILEAGGSLIVPAGSAIQTESGPVNGVIDPGETVTVLLSLRNASGTNTQNLVASLLPTPGVSNPSGPQSYGSLEVRGASAFRPFTFTANGTNGQPLNVTLQLNDNGTSLSNVVYALSIGNIPSAWSNSTTIVINDFTNAAPYPSIINVSGLNGAVNKATVTLTNFNHTWPRDVSVLLVSPGGQKSYLTAKAGGSIAANNVTLTFDDAAASPLSYTSQLISGTNRPTSYASAAPPFPVPAPPPPYSTNLGAFNGSNPNGNWALYVYDDKGWDSGAISNGWILRLNTGAPAAADVGIAASSLDDTVVAGSNLTYTVTVVNYGPAGASNIVVSDILPAAYVSNTRSQGSAGTNGNGLLTWNVGSLGTNTSATLTVVVRPPTPGLYTNVVTVVSSTTDLNLDNNSASATALAVVPTADLVLGLAGAPNPVLAGEMVTYTISVTNLGPATAPSLRVTDTLPPGFSFVSSTPAGAAVSGRTITFANLGDLSSDGYMIVSVLARANVPGTFTNSVSCSALVTDPLKGNNSAAVKTDVISLTLGVVRVGNNLVFSWPADANMSLYSSASLVPPVAWSPVTNPPPVLVGGQMTVTIPIGPGSMFFRLAGTAP